MNFFFNSERILSGPPSYLKHFHLNRLPFRQQPDPEVFFAEAGRDGVLHDLCVDIIGGKPLIKLIGGEGTGKTLLYLLVARKLGIKKFDIVSLDHPAGSFEDLLGIVCRALSGCEERKPDGGDEVRTGHLSELLALLKERNSSGHRVVLLIDEAEQLFQATLERLVRLVADIGQERLLQVLLVGRPELDRNLQQLSGYCDQVDIHAGYTLAPLSLEETGMYLRFRLVQAGASAEQAEEIFSAGTISSLYQGARGNLGLTNLLAEQGLVKADESGMSQVSAEQVSPRQRMAQGSSPVRAPSRVRLRRYRLQAAAGALLGLALLLIVYWPKGKETDPPVAPEVVAVAEKPAPVSAPMAQKTPAAPAGDSAATSAGTPPAEPLAKPPAAPPVTAQAPAVVPVAEEKPGAAPAPPEKKEPPAVTPAKEKQPAAATPALAAPVAPRAPESVPARPEPASQAVEQAKMAAPEAPPQEARKIVDLRPGPRKTKVAGGAPGAGQPAARPGKDPARVFAQRLRASSAWQAKSGYTIQLMALASNTAEENFKGLLAQDRYAAVQNQLYVVRKAVPPTLFVFYGFFATKEEARQGREKLPEFLRKNQPYTLPIEQAVQKAKE